MKTHLFVAIVLSALGLGTACGGEDDAGGPDAPVGGGPDAPPGTPDAGAGGYVELIGGDWSLPAGAEDYVCVRRTIPEDMWITEFHPVIPTGTHHTVVTIDNPGVRADGTYPCNVAENGSKRGIYGTGVGANDFVLPEGVAMKVSAGEQVVLNLHLYNTSDAPLSGHSGIDAKTIPQAQVVNEADSDLIGTISAVVIPPGPQTVSTRCTVNQPVTLFALSPHMHRLGVHSRVTYTAGGGAPQTLHDMPYSFESQLLYVLSSPLQLAPGDDLYIDCEYNNTTGAQVTWGDSSDDEMCFLGIYRYPAGAGNIACNPF